MVRIGPDQQLLPSVFDRLMEGDEVIRRHGQTLAQLRMSIRRDLEDLLNTRQRFLSPPNLLEKLADSLINYGIPDPIGYDLSSSDRIEKFREQVETAIKRFERRFREVRVKLLGEREITNPVLRFRIEASMSVELAPEPLVFSLDVEPTTKKISVRTAT